MCIHFICPHCHKPYVGQDSRVLCDQAHLLPEDHQTTSTCPTNDFQYLVRSGGQHGNGGKCPALNTKYHSPYSQHSPPYLIDLSINNPPRRPDNHPNLSDITVPSPNSTMPPPRSRSKGKGKSPYVPPGDLFDPLICKRIASGPCAQTYYGKSLGFMCQHLNNRAPNGVAGRYFRESYGGQVGEEDEVEVKVEGGYGWQFFGGSGGGGGGVYGGDGGGGGMMPPPPPQLNFGKPPAVKPSMIAGSFISKDGVRVPLVKVETFHNGIPGTITRVPKGTTYNDQKGKGSGSADGGHRPGDGLESGAGGDGMEEPEKKLGSPFQPKMKSGKSRSRRG